MNFLLHRHLASRDLLSGTAGIGAMLPDLWRMADRRVRPTMATPMARPGDDASIAAVLAGVDHHLRADRWFHAHEEAFAGGERRMVERLRASGLDAPKITRFAHVAWELCLDGALVRREGLEHTLEALWAGLSAARGAPLDEAASRHHFSRVERTEAERKIFDDGMRRLFSEIAGGRWVAGYAEGVGIAQRIDGMRRRLGFVRLSRADLERLSHAFDGIAIEAHAALAQIEAADIG